MDNRDNAIDVYKGLLTVLMIASHAAQFFLLNAVTWYYSSYINLTTFSGFMFSFGYVCSHAYIDRNIDRPSLFKKTLKGFLKALIAFYISGIAYTVFVDRDISVQSMMQILALAKIPSYSEFLLSFAFIYPLIFVFKPLLRKVNRVGALVLLAASLALTFVRINVIALPVISVFVGTDICAGFPILCYMGYFIAGMYLSRTKQVFNIFIMIIAVLGTGAFSLYYASYGLPGRFPPTMLWIVGGYLFVYAYFLICKNGILKSCVLAQIGSRSLYYLVGSNAAIFFVSYITAR